MVFFMQGANQFISDGYIGFDRMKKFVTIDYIKIGISDRGK